MLNPTNIYTLKKGCENRIFGFPQKYHVKTTQDTTQVTFRAFQAKLGPVNFFSFLIVNSDFLLQTFI